MEDGRYSYRFDGFAMKKGLPFVIAGIGSIEVAKLKVVRGAHRSSLARIEGSGAELIHSHFTVQGHVAFVREEDGWDVELVFSEQDAPSGREPQQLTGWFRAVEAGPDRYWIISTGAVTTMGGAQERATEVVHGEVVKVG